VAASPVPDRTPPARTTVPATSALRPLALVGLAFGAVSTIADPDLWGHVRFGLDIIANGGVTSGSDPYSFTADRPFLYHEWLGGTIMAAAYQFAGPAGLMALKALLASAPSVLTWFLLRRAQFAWRWLGTGLVAWGMLAIAFTVRPQVWSAILLVALGAVLTRGSTHTLWFLPIVFALWANLHGGWIVGGGILAVWTAVAWLERSNRRWSLVAVGVASLLCTLVTPYGLDLWRFLLDTVRLGRADISEWSPIWRAGIGFAVMWTLTVALIADSWRRHGRPPLAPLITLAVFAFAAARVNRLVPLFAIVTVTLLSRQWPRELSAPPRDGARLLFDGVCVAAFIVAGLSAGAVKRCISLDHKAAPDTIAAEALRGARGRLVTHFDWGEYALWHFGPALKVSIDGRRETVYTAGVLHEQLAIAAGAPEGVAALERIRPEYVWLPAESSTAANWLREHGYREAVRTERSFVAVREDLPLPSPLTGQTSGCFPGP
jgi:hypothetical protein